MKSSSSVQAGAGIKACLADVAITSPAHRTQCAREQDRNVLMPPLSAAQCQRELVRPVDQSRAIGAARQERIFIM